MNAKDLKKYMKNLLENIPCDSDDVIIESIKILLGCDESAKKDAGVLVAMSQSLFDRILEISSINGKDFYEYLTDEIEGFVEFDEVHNRMKKEKELKKLEELHKSCSLCSGKGE